MQICKALYIGINKKEHLNCNKHFYELVLRFHSAHMMKSKAACEGASLSDHEKRFYCQASREWKLVQKNVVGPSITVQRQAR